MEDTTQHHHHHHHHTSGSGGHHHSSSHHSSHSKNKHSDAAEEFKNWNLRRRVFRKTFAKWMRRIMIVLAVVLGITAIILWIL